MTKGPYGRQCRNKVKIGVYCHVHRVEYNSGVQHCTHVQRLTNRTTKPNTDLLSVLGRDIIQLIGPYLVWRDNVRFGLTCHNIFTGLHNSVVWCRKKDHYQPLLYPTTLQRVFPVLYHKEYYLFKNIRNIVKFQVHTLKMELSVIRTDLLETLQLKTEDIETLIIPSVTTFNVRLMHPGGHYYEDFYRIPNINVDFIGCFRNLQTLKIETPGPLNNLDKVFAKLCNLRKLKIIGTDELMTSIKLQSIELCRELILIHIDNCNLSETKGLAKLTKLKTLRITTESLAALGVIAEIHSLEYLYLHIKEFEDDEQLPDLGGLVNLRTAYFEGIPDLRYDDRGYGSRNWVMNR